MYSVKSSLYRCSTLAHGWIGCRFTHLCQTLPWYPVSKSCRCVYCVRTWLVALINQYIKCLPFFALKISQRAHSIVLGDAWRYCLLRWGPAGAPLPRTCPGHVVRGFWLRCLCRSEEPRHSVCYSLDHVILECLSQIMCSGCKGESCNTNWVEFSSQTLY